MVEKKQPEDAVRNILKNGTMPAKEEYMKAAIYCRLSW